MTTSIEPRSSSAWQPLTRRGVAAFARATVGRLLAVQLVFAALAAACVVWFLQAVWFPVITDAIRQMPADGEIRGGTLHWRGESPFPLAERHALALAVDLNHSGNRRSPAHIQVEFGRADCLVISLFGSRSAPYPPAVVFPFGRTGLEPLWGAWRPALLAIAAGTVALGLMLVWGVLASVYALPAYLAGRFARRDLSLGASWRLAGAALMPGALMMDLAILAYGLAVLDLIHLGLALALHLVVGWGFLGASVACCPARPQGAELADNPFRAGTLPPPPPP